MGKILAIADAATLEVVQELLGREGHQVRVAPDAGGGLELARELSPDAIICDGTSPQIDWLEVCRLVKADRELAAVYFVLLTTPEQFAEVQELDALFDDFLFKPIVKQELLGRVRAGWRSGELRAQLERRLSKNCNCRAIEYCKVKRCLIWAN